MNDEQEKSNIKKRKIMKGLALTRKNEKKELDI